MEQIRKLLEDAATSVKQDYDETSARLWAQDFRFPVEQIENDINCLRAEHLDFVEMVSQRRRILADGRLSDERIDRLRTDNPEIALLRDLACGMRVFLPEGFAPNGLSIPSPLRSTYVAVSTAVNKMLYDLVQQKLAFVLPYHMAREFVPRLHLAKAHWTRKKGKASGRPLSDLTFVDGTPLNSPETAEAAALYYGHIGHPTIESIVVMINTFWDDHVRNNPLARWEDLRIWKMDLRGAYQLLSFRPEDVGLFGMMLTEELVYFQIAGIFGWTGTPAAFQVITRAITFELRHCLRSSVSMYVDDIIGVGMAEFIAEDLQQAKDTCNGLLGPTAIAEDKTETGRRVEVIGYTIDLNACRVLIANKNFLKALHGFASLDTDKAVNLQTAQRIASWASRYGKICRVMRPFCGALNRLTVGRTSTHAVFPLTAEARTAIRCWRAMLCLVRFHESEFTRTLRSFSPAHPTTVAVFDSSLSGVGVVWYERTDGAEVARGVCAVDILHLGFADDSSFQNLAEFIGALLAVAGHIALGQCGRSLTLRGDSVTALTWALTERPRGAIVTRAAMVWAQLCVAADVHISDVQHISGEDNHLCDALSRRGYDHPMLIGDHAVHLGVIGARTFDAQNDPDVMALVGLCKPVSVVEDDHDFAEFWTTIRRTIDSFLARHPLQHS